MFTDVAGYTALGQKNESRSLALIDTQKRLIRPILKKHHGREVKTIGDAFLIEFPNALDAVRCAYDIQRATREFNISLPDDRRLHLRIGLHLGDVTESRGDILGDAVNIASRIESLAENGGVCMTQQVYDHVRNKFETPLKSLGKRPLKNVSEPIEVYKMVLPWEEAKNQSMQLDATRIAVLPFANMSPDPNDSYFADGITEEIISTLSGISGLSVISRTSVMGYKGTTKKVKEIGNELEVGSVLEGSFRKAGNKIRVTAQLIAVDADMHVWAQSYDRNLDDVFATQTEIARNVSDALRVRVLERERNRIDRRPTESTKAYGLYLRGRYHWNKRGIEDVKTAANYFTQALNEDPEFSLGYVGLADSHMILGSNWDIEKTANLKKAEEEVTKALELDEDLAEAHATRGLLLMTNFDLREAEKEFTRAIELKPSYASAHQWYFLLLRSQLRLEEALIHIEKAVELDPFTGVINANHASYYSSTGDLRKALDIQQKATELVPNLAAAHFDLAEKYGQLGIVDGMRRELKIATSLAREASPHVDLTEAAMIAYFAGDLKALGTLARQLEKIAGERYAPNALQMAGTYFRLGDRDKGFEWLEKSLARKEFDLLQIKSYFMFEGIRDDPRYLNLLERIGID